MRINKITTYLFSLSLALSVVTSSVAYTDLNVYGAEADGDILDNPYDEFLNDDDKDDNTGDKDDNNNGDDNTVGNTNGGTNTGGNSTGGSTNGGSANNSNTTVVKSFKIKKSSQKYVVTNQKSKTVKLVGVSVKKATVVIPSTVTYKGVKYKVTAIAPNAFKNNKKIRSITIGKYVKSIGKNSFYGCTKLAKISIKSTSLKSVGKNAFKKTNVKAKIKVPKKKFKAYKKLLYKKGLSKKAKITK